MFTGIIDEVGPVAALERGVAGGGARLTLRASKALAQPGRLVEGESIAVNGVCLTAKDITTETFAADLSPETLERSSLRTLRAGARVNLERAMTPSTRFGGHIVQGHVDGVGKLVALDPLPDGNYALSVDLPVDLVRYVVWKGSIALHGISLTVARLDGCRVGVAIIPHTYENTNLPDLRPGDPVNVECDVLAKYVERLLATMELGQTSSPVLTPPSTLTIERLLEEGF